MALDPSYEYNAPQFVDFSAPMEDADEGLDEYFGRFNVFKACKVLVI